MDALGLLTHGIGNNSVQVRGQTVFPIILPTLIASPITAFKAHALASLISAGGDAVSQRLSTVVDALRNASEIEKDSDTLAEIENALRALFGSVTEVSSLMMHLLSMSKAPSASRRVAGCELFAVFCQVGKADFSAFYVDWLRQLVSLFDDREPTVVAAAWDAADALTKKIPKDEMEGLVVPLRRMIENTGMPGVDLLGFSRPNGLRPVLRT
jgi:hypothetical protein